LKVHGSVRDSEGTPINSAVISFSNLETTAETVATTGEDGFFHVALPTGRYRVRTSAHYFLSEEQPSLELVGDTNLTFSLPFEGDEFSTCVACPSPVSAPIPKQIPLLLNISVIRFVAPTYPAIARTARVMGDVRLAIAIAADGSAANVTTLNGHPMLSQAAMDAVKQWRFGFQRPAKEAIHIVTVRFRIKDVETCDAPSNTTVEPALPDLVTVWTNSVCVETVTQTRDPVVRDTWPSPWVFGGTSARPNPIRD